MNNIFYRIVQFRSQFRNDRMMCNCDYQDFPHRYDPFRCEPGYTTVDAQEEAGKRVTYPRAPKKKVPVLGFKCQFCGEFVPLPSLICDNCGR